MTTVRIFLALPCLPTLIVLAMGGSASAQTAGSDIHVPPQPAESLLLLDDVVRESLEKKRGTKRSARCQRPRTASAAGKVAARSNGVGRMGGQSGSVQPSACRSVDLPRSHDFRTNSASRQTEARGLWQLTPDTARRYGLRVDDLQDDRSDLAKSTDAAARYLHDLYSQFGDWKLALAAYNVGEAKVGHAILRAHAQDFEQLTDLHMLPLETRNCVPRLLAAAQLFGRTTGFAASSRVENTTTVFARSNHPCVGLSLPPSVTARQSHLSRALRQLMQSTRRIADSVATTRTAYGQSRQLRCIAS